MRDVAIVGFAQVPNLRRGGGRDGVEMVLEVANAVRTQTGLDKDEIGFTVSGSCDFLRGAPFAFVMALDGVGPFPPIAESHVEMDGAWALYEAWVRLQHGDIDTALVYCFGISSAGDLPDVMTMQLDPYTVAPLWPDAVSVAALQARALLDGGRYSERDMAEVASANRRRGQGNPYAHLTGDFDPEALLADPYLVAPLRRHDCPPISDGACAVILAAGDKAKACAERPAWIRGIDHRIDPHHLGSRDLTACASASLAAEAAGVGADKLDVVELHAPFTHQELILRDAMGIDADAVQLNPSGGALCANPIMVAGLTRLGEAAQRIMDGDADRAMAHATSGPALQQNLVCVMEGE